jgi:rhodanese-related sulfurtransferase
MSVQTITPQEAHERLIAGAVLVDIREHDEHARERIPGARHHALSRIDAAPLDAADVIIFHCRSGNRTAVNAAKLKAAVPGAQVHILEGGIEAWRDAGLPTLRDATQPIEILRQVQIAAGSLVVAGVALGALVHPGLYAVAAFVGAGLVFAGATGTCAMARILGLAPWNRRATPSATA